MLPAWSGNLGKRLVKAPKLLLCDTGLAAHLAGVDAERLSREFGLVGPLLENFVAMELRKQSAWSRMQPRLFHFRTQTGQEVDLVLEDRAGRIVGIEVKAGATVGAQDFKGLRMLAEAVGKRFRRGVVLYTGTTVIPFGANLHALPVSALPCDGTFPTGTARFEKRAIAQEIPVWDPSICIDCAKCVLVCPHAAIRMKVFEPQALEGAPASFLSKE